MRNKNGNEVRGIRRETAAAFVLSSLGCLLLFALLVSFANLRVLFALLVSAVVYAAAVVAIRFFLEKKTRVNSENLRPMMGQIMFDAIVKLPSPVFICDATEEIVWYNTETESLCSKKKLYGARLSDVFGFTLADVRKCAGDGLAFSYGGRSFLAQYNHIKTDDGDFSLIVTAETTAADELEAELQSSSLAVAYIMIDNLGEMLQYDSEQYRPAAAKIDEILRDWADEYGAILKEYERDKYFLVTDAAQLHKMIEAKFDLLDRVRAVRAGDTNLPLTVSMGVSAIHGTYEEKDKAAHAALDMALQRGGDQAAVKSDESMEFFGGVTKTVQKKTNVRARVVSNELMNEIRASSNVLIMGHKRADFDSFGACVGLARLALFCGADVRVVLNMADRNLTLPREILASEKDYGGLFVSATDALDMLSTDTLVIVTDVSNLAITEEPELARRTERLAVIDHHRKMAEFEREVDIEYIEPSASSACELVSEMLEQVLPKDALSSPEANVILAGIALDTKQFTKNTGTRTFSSAMYLRDKGADPTLIQELFRESFDDYVREAKFRRSVETYRSVYAITVVDTDGEETDEGDRVIAAKAADNLLKVEGIEASFAVIREGDTVHISARSSGKINVQLIMEEMGGGGHFDGAAVQCSGKSADEVVAMLKSAIDRRCEGAHLA